MPSSPRSSQRDRRERLRAARGRDRGHLVPATLSPPSWPARAPRPRCSPTSAVRAARPADFFPSRIPASSRQTPCTAQGLPHPQGRGWRCGCSSSSLPPLSASRLPCVPAARALPPKSPAWCTSRTRCSAGEPLLRAQSGCHSPPPIPSLRLPQAAVNVISSAIRCAPKSPRCATSRSPVTADASARVVTGGARGAGAERVVPTGSRCCPLAAPAAADPAVPRRGPRAVRARYRSHDSPAELCTFRGHGRAARRPHVQRARCGMTIAELTVGAARLLCRCRSRRRPPAGNTREMSGRARDDPAESSRNGLASNPVARPRPRRSPPPPPPLELRPAQGGAGPGRPVEASAGPS